MHGGADDERARLSVERRLRAEWNRLMPFEANGERMLLFFGMGRSRCLQHFLKPRRATDLLRVVLKASYCGVEKIERRMFGAVAASDAAQRTSWLREVESVTKDYFPMSR